MRLTIFPPLGLVLVVFACFVISVSSNPLKIQLTVHKKNSKQWIIQPNDYQTSTRDIVIQIKKLYYIGGMNIGDPAKTFKVSFDIGYADLWVGSSQLCAEHPYYCNDHETYNHSESSVFDKEMESQPFSLKYKNLFIQGSVVKDLVAVGRYSLFQKFAEVTEMDDQSLSSPYDGILGLGFKLFSTIDDDSLLDNLLKEGVGTEPVFSFYINKNPREPAELYLGGADSNHFKGKFTFAPVNSIYQWSILLSRILVDQTEVVGYYDQYNAVIDPGAEMIYGPPGVIDKINEVILRASGKDQQYSSYVDYNKLSSMPAVTFLIRTHNFVMSPDDYVVKDTGDSGEMLGYLSGFKSIDHLNVVILGASFMRKFYTQFNFGDEPKIGFATAK